MMEDSMQRSPVLDESILTGAKAERSGTPMDGKIGQIMMYYCKTCEKHSPSLQSLIDHVKLNDCEVNNENSSCCLMTDKQDTFDHSYASDAQGHSNSLKLDTKPDTEASTSSRNELEYKCTSCPHTKLLSATELELHMMCHAASGFSTLYICHLCQANKADKGLGLRGRRLALTADWDKVKVHLTKVHKTDFKLKCVTCQYSYSSHDKLAVHSRSHEVRCGSCSYTSMNGADLRLHERCHVTHDLFRCCLCESQKHAAWAQIHHHLVETHAGAITPDCLCQRCGCSLQKSAYNHHYKDCILKVACEQCGKSVLTSKLPDHIRQEHEDPDRQSSETDTSCLSPSNVVKAPDEINLTKRTTEPLSERGIEPVKAVETSHLKCLRHRLTFTSNEEMEEHFNKEHKRSKPKQYADYVLELDDGRSKMSRFDEATDTESSGAKITPGTNINLDGDEDDDDNDKDYRPSATYEESDENESSQSTIHPGCAADVPILDKDPETWSGNHRSVSKTMKEGKKRKRSITSREADINKRLRCRLCYKVFADETRLAGHMRRSHTDEKMKPLSCPQCDKVFRTQVQRRNHVRQVHEGVKRVHKRISGKPKIYHRCDLCQFSTPDKVRLNYHHQAVHLGVMPFSCEYCNYQTKERSDIHRHKLRHMGVKKHQCPVCPYQSLERWVMVKHCRKQHQIEVNRKEKHAHGESAELQKAATDAVRGTKEIKLITDASGQIIVTTENDFVNTLHILEGDQMASSGDLDADDFLCSMSQEVDTVQNIEYFSVETVQDIEHLREVMSVTQEVIPAAQEDISVVQEDTSVARVTSPTDQESTPTAQKIIHTAQKIVPTAHEIMPMSQEITVEMEDGGSQVLYLQEASTEHPENEVIYLEREGSQTAIRYVLVAADDNVNPSEAPLKSD